MDINAKSTREQIQQWWVEKAQSLRIPVNQAELVSDHMVQAMVDAQEHSGPGLWANAQLLGDVVEQALASAPVEEFDSTDERSVSPLSESSPLPIDSSKPLPPLS